MMPEFVSISDPGGVLFVDRSILDKRLMSALTDMRPGSVIQVEDIKQVMYIPPQLLFEYFGFVAGMVSDCA